MSFSFHIVYKNVYIQTLYSHISYLHRGKISDGCANSRKISHPKHNKSTQILRFYICKTYVSECTTYMYDFIHADVVGCMD